MSWRHEFAGRVETFDVPESIIRLEGLEDMSWHNDTCPSFGVRIGESLDLRIWCEAINPEDRESGGDHRFTINAAAWDEPSWEVLRAATLDHITGEFPEPAGAPISEFGTDDPDTAVVIFFTALSHLQAARRALGEPIPAT